MKNQWTEALKQENWTVPEDGFSYDEVRAVAFVTWLGLTVTVDEQLPVDEVGPFMTAY